MQSVFSTALAEWAITRLYYQIVFLWLKQHFLLGKKKKKKKKKN